MLVLVLLKMILIPYNRHNLQQNNHISMYLLFNDKIYRCLTKGYTIYLQISKRHKSMNTDYFYQRSKKILQKEKVKSIKYIQQPVKKKTILISALKCENNISDYYFQKTINLKSKSTKNILHSPDKHFISPIQPKANLTLTAQQDYYEVLKNIPKEKQIKVIKTLQQQSQIRPKIFSHMNSDLVKELKLDNLVDSQIIDGEMTSQITEYQNCKEKM